MKLFYRFAGFMTLIASFLFVMMLGMMTFETSTSYGATMNAKFKWSYNGVAVDGFRMYVKGADQVMPVMVKEIVGGDLREWEGDLEVEEGISHYTLTAYLGAMEGDPSVGFDFEYIMPMIERIGTPTLIFIFN